VVLRGHQTLAACGGSRTEPFGADSGRMQGAAKRRILEVFKRAATQQTAQNLPERRRGDFHHGLLGLCSVEGHVTGAQEVPLMAWGLLFNI
jgi:hypothetical protein